MLFQSWNGTFSDNPRAIAEEIHRRQLPLHLVWVTAPGQAAPDWMTSVRSGSSAHLRALGMARYVIANTSLPGYFIKKQRTYYLQTWHGTPLKKIAFDVQNSQFRARSRGFLDGLAHDVPQWNALISPNAVSTPILRNAFCYAGTVLETGYPRTDLLVGSDPARRDAVRRRLGLSGDEVAVLYAPTWRDQPTFDLKLDLEMIGTALPGHVVLYRPHPLVASSAPVESGPRVRNVAGEPDIRELLLASDVLITDYSSVMFDFGVTGKPQIFFAYDLESYRDDLRGFNFDFCSEVPGPVVRTAADVLEALRDLDEVRRLYAPAYERFRERFCHLDDGSAAVRVVDRVLGSRVTPG